MVPYFDSVERYIENLEPLGNGAKDLRTHTFYAWDKSNISNERKDEIVVAPPWFEGLFISGIGEHSPGPALALKATEKFEGRNTGGNAYLLESGAHALMSGISIIHNNGESNEFNRFQGFLESQGRKYDFLSVDQYFSRNSLVGWYIRNGAFRSVYGVPKTVTSNTRLLFGSTIATPTKMYINDSTNYLFVHESPFETISSYGSFGMSVCVKISPALIFEAEKHKEEVLQNSKEENGNFEEGQLPKLFVGFSFPKIVVLLLTSGMKLVAWRRHKKALPRDGGKADSKLWKLLRRSHPLQLN